MASYIIKDGRQYYNNKAVDNRFAGVDNVEFVELRLNAGTYQGLQKFPDQPQLDGMEINAIETYCDDDVPQSFQTQGLVVVDITALISSALVLYESQKYDDDGGAYKDGVKYLPLVSLHRVDNGSNPFVRDLPIFACNRVQWLKSGVVIGPSITFETDVAFVFAVYYTSKVPTLR